MDYTKKKVKIIILSGLACSGKSLVASMIKDYYVKKNIKVIDVAYASYLKEYAKRIVGWDGSEESKPRDFLQSIGVDLIKNKIDDHFLINRVKEDIEVYSYFYDVIVISDARFVDEILEIKDVYDDVVVINIVRNVSNLTSIQRNHITETALNDYHDYDYKIFNDSIVELSKQLSVILEVI